MKITITADKLRQYNRYGGDIDAFLRMNRGKENAVFGADFPDSWHEIANKFQDMGLISKREASQEYVNNILDELAEICDTQSFEVLVNNIPFYSCFQEIAAILEEIKSKIDADSDTIWAGFDSVDDFLRELNEDIQNIKHCNFDTLRKIQTEFGPTSTYQELSISNGWGEYYLMLAERFDNLFDEIKRLSANEDQKKPWWKFF